MIRALRLINNDAPLLREQCDSISPCMFCLAKVVEIIKMEEVQKPAKGKTAKGTKQTL
jgi:hypothetical protein